MTNESLFWEAHPGSLDNDKNQDGIDRDFSLWTFGPWVFSYRTVFSPSSNSQCTFTFSKSGEEI